MPERPENGYCAPGCDPLTTGSCTDGVCLFVSTDPNAMPESLADPEWRCSPEAIYPEPLVAEGEMCEIGGGLARCGESTVCVRSGGTNVCAPACDPAAASPCDAAEECIDKMIEMSEPPTTVDVCVTAEGGLDEACHDDGTCDEMTLSCVNDPMICSPLSNCCKTAGSEGTSCATATCDTGLDCIDIGICNQPPCCVNAGGEGEVCLDGGACDGTLTCVPDPEPGLCNEGADLDPMRGCCVDIRECTVDSDCDEAAGEFCADAGSHPQPCGGFDRCCIIQP